MSENVNEMKDANEEVVFKKHSTKDMISYCINIMAIQIISVIFVTRLFIFYETNVGLSIGLIGLGYSIYTIWDAFNEPFSGYLSDRPNRLWKRWGKRFPWIVFSAIPISISFFLIFIPPDPAISEIATFLWFLIILCVYDGIYSIWNLNFLALLPDKYRSEKERTKVSGLRVPFHVGGLLIGLILPPLIIEYGNQASYITMALVVTILLVVLTIVSIPGLREDEEMRKRTLETIKTKHEPFFKSLRNSFKHKNFRIWVIAGIMAFAWDALLVSAIPYYVQYVLRLDAEVEIFLYLPYLFAGIIFIPLWTKLCNKYGHWKIYKIGLLIRPLTFIPILFISDLGPSIIFVFIMGAAIGGTNIALQPVQGDLMDEAALLHGDRHEGRYFGIYTFVAKAGNFIQVIVIVLLHTLTNFNPTPGAVQTPLAILGIRFHLALAPLILMSIEAFIFIKWWDLIPEKTAEIQVKIQELKL